MPMYYAIFCLIYLIIKSIWDFNVGIGFNYVDFAARYKIIPFEIGPLMLQ